MGAASGVLGTAGGALGTGISAPRRAGIEEATDKQDVDNAELRATKSLKDQHALLKALQKQGGLSQQNALADQLAAANGIGTQNQAISGLAGAANMYQNIAQGNGPNPAMAALHQATGQNVANQAALMAGQRGAGANAGLIARQAAQQGAATQQQAVGQGATMQAQQQLNALTGLTGAQQAMGSLGTTQAQMQQAQANQLAGQQITQNNQNAQAALSNQQQMQNALAAYNNASVSGQNSLNAANTAMINQMQSRSQAAAGGSMSGAGSAIGMMAAAAQGGEVIKMANGGFADQAVNSSAPQSMFGQFLVNGPNYGISDAPINMEAIPGDDMTQAGSDLGKSIGAYAKQSGGQQTNAQSWAGPDSAPAAGGGGFGGGATAVAAQGGLATTGGHVFAKSSSQKAVKSGDSYDNDKIPAKLSEGEIVLPRSVTMSKDPVRSAADFVAKVIAKRKVK